MGAELNASRHVQFDLSTIREESFMSATSDAFNDSKSAPGSHKQSTTTRVDESDPVSNLPQNGGREREDFWNILVHIFCVFLGSRA